MRIDRPVLRSPARLDNCSDPAQASMVEDLCVSRAVGLTLSFLDPTADSAP